MKQSEKMGNIGRLSPDDGASWIGLVDSAETEDVEGVGKLVRGPMGRKEAESSGEGGFRWKSLD